MVFSNFSCILSFFGGGEGAVKKVMAFFSIKVSLNKKYILISLINISFCIKEEYLYSISAYFLVSSNNMKQTNRLGKNNLVGAEQAIYGANQSGWEIS